MEPLIIEAVISAETLEKIAQRASEINADKNVKQKVSDAVSVTKQWYTVLEMEELTGIKEASITRHIRAGLIEATRPGKSYLISIDSINEYLNRNNNG